MKRFVSVGLLMLCLSLPVFAGHNLAGGWCQNGTAGCAPDGNGMVFAESTQDTPIDLGSETLLILAVLLVMLRYKA